MDNSMTQTGNLKPLYVTETLVYCRIVLLLPGSAGDGRPVYHYYTGIYFLQLIIT